MEKIYVNLKTEHIFRNRPKPQPLKISDAAKFHKELCALSKVFTTYTHLLDDSLSRSHDLVGTQREISQDVCQTLTNVHNQVQTFKDSLTNFLSARQELHETQSGFVREHYKALKTYLDKFDVETFCAKIKTLDEMEENNPGLLKATSGYPFAKCNPKTMIIAAVSKLRGVVDSYEHTSI